TVIRVGRRRSGIELRRDSRQHDRRLCRGGECEPTRVAVKIDRLDAQAVAPDDQPPATCVPQREAEHAVQPVDELVAVLRVAVEDDLAVRPGLESMANRFQLAAQLTKDRKSTRLNSSHEWISYAVFCL